mgnify:FL=1
MNKKTLEKLEYPKIITLLVQQASSERGKLLCRNLKPSSDLSEIQTAQEQTAAAFTRIVQKGRISFSDVATVEASMKRLEVGGSLSIIELLRISGVLKTAGAVKAYGRHDTTAEASDCLDVYFDQLEPVFPLNAEIEHCILGEDEISDDASPTLNHIRL